MKKLIFFLVTVVASVMSVSAQSISPVISCEKVGAGYVMCVDSNKINVQARDYYTALKNPGHAYFVQHTDFSGVVAESEFVEENLAVDSVGVDSVSTIVVYFNNKSLYKTKNANWLSLAKGSQIRHIKINAPWRVFERYVTLAPTDSKIKRGTLSKDAYVKTESTTTESEVIWIKYSY